MKFRKDKDILKLLGFSFGIILAGILILLFIPQIGTIGIFSISSGIVGLIICLRLATKPIEYFLEDERSKRVKQKAGYYAYEIMSITAAAILVLSVLKLSPLLTPSGDIVNGALLIWLIGLYSFLILKWYYNKKGE